MRIATLSTTLALALGIASLAAAEEITASPVGEEHSAPGAPSPSGSSGRSPIDGVKGHLGLGYFTNTAPIGVRYWMSRDSAFDFGMDGALSSGDIDAYRLGFEAGYVMALAHYHYSVVFARAGLGLRYRDSFGNSATRGRWDVGANAFLGAELFLGAFGFPNISLTGGYGVEMAYTRQGGSAFIIGTSAGGLNVVSSGTFGFHIYL